MPAAAPKQKARIYGVFRPVLVRRCSSDGGDGKSRLLRRREKIGEEFVAANTGAKIRRRRFLFIADSEKAAALDNRKGRARTPPTAFRAGVAIRRISILIIHARRQRRRRVRSRETAAAAGGALRCFFVAELFAAGCEIHNKQNTAARKHPTLLPSLVNSPMA